MAPSSGGHDCEPGNPSELPRASCQAGSTLTEFFQAHAARDEVPAGLRSVPQQMLELLPGLSQACATRMVWGLTSHMSLWLLAEDDYQSPWHVQIEAVSWGGYVVRYRMPPREAPWPGALVEGHVDTSREALERVAIAMEGCGAWSVDDAT